MSPPDLKRILADYTDTVLSGHDLDALDDFVSSEQLKKAAIWFVTSFPDLKVTLELMVTEGDIVACRARGSGTHTGGQVRGIEPSGRPWNATCNAFFEIKDGKISNAWTLWDWATIMEQLQAKSA